MNAGLHDELLPFQGNTKFKRRAECVPQLQTGTSWGYHLSAPYPHTPAGLPLAATPRRAADLLLWLFGKHLLGSRNQSVLMVRCKLQTIPMCDREIATTLTLIDESPQQKRPPLAALRSRCGTCGEVCARRVAALLRAEPVRAADTPQPLA